MTTSFNASKPLSSELSLLTKTCSIKTAKEKQLGKVFSDLVLSNPSTFQIIIPIEFSLLNRPHETLCLEPHKGLSTKGHLIAWIKKEDGKDTCLEEVAVRGFRGVEGKELLDKIMHLGEKNFVAIRVSQEVVLLPRLEGAVLDDEDVTEDFIRRFNENTLNHAEYKAKALEFALKLREMGGLENVAATALNKVRAGFVRLAKCKDEGVIEAAMLSLYEFEEKSRAGLPKQDLTASSFPSSLRSSFGSAEEALSRSAPEISGAAKEGLIQAFLELLEILDSEYFITITPDTQCIILKAYNSLLESIIFYSGQEGQIPLVSRMRESRKKAIIGQLQKVKGLTWTDNQPEATYLVQLALEGSKRLADDSKSWEKGARRMVKFCVALKAAWDQDISNVIESLVHIYKDVEILKDWYELVYVIREMGKSAAQDRRHFTNFMRLINDKKVQKGSWELSYTAASSLGEIIKNSQDPYVRLCALEGYDPEGKGVLFKGLWTYACFKGYSTLMSKPNEIEVSRVRYKATQALKSLYNHKDAEIMQKVCFYLSERETRESTPCIKLLLAMPLILPEQRVRDLLTPKAPLFSSAKDSQAKTVFPQTERSTTRSLFTESSVQKRLSGGDFVGLSARNDPEKRSVATGQDTVLPPVEKNSLIRKKLKNPQQELSLEESLTLLTQCIQYGKIEAQKAQGKAAVIFIGNTGAGKSTTINYLYGCTMQLQSVDDLDAELEDIIVVQPPSEGGRLEEVMPIGHTKESKTFMPQIETNPEQNITYCDCPGFLDNRGAEINIANAVNIKNAIAQAKSVTVIILINYHSLRADRARGLTEMLKISCNLFGKADNLIKHKESILIGVTNIPSNMKLERLKKWIVKDTTPLMETLAERIFIFDPLDRPLDGGLRREDLLSRIQSLKPITNPSKIFSTVLTDEDETKLIRISEQIGQKIQAALKTKDFKQAASHFQHLQELRLIEHVTIERLLSANHQRIERQLQDEKTAIMTHCHFERFTQAKQLLQELKEAVGYFDAEIAESLKLSEVRRYYEDSKQKTETAFRKEQEYNQQLAAAHTQIQEFITLLEKQKRHTEEQLRHQQENFVQAMQEMENTMKRTATDYEQMKKELQKEMKIRLAQKEEELKAIQGQNLSEIQQKLEQEKASLSFEYTQKLHEMERERKRVAAEQQALKDKAVHDLQAEKARLQQQLQDLENSKQQKLAEQKRQEEERVRLEKLRQEKALREESIRKKTQWDDLPPPAYQQPFTQKAVNGFETEKARLQQKIQEFEISKQEQQWQEEELARFEKAKQEKARMEAFIRQSTPITPLPPQAFGKKEWEKYFGDVGVEPPLPANIHQILQSPCPIWSGNKVADTHLLTLIPQTVNGRPLTLNYLEELIKNPKGGGNRSKYSYYNEDVRNAIGKRPVERSYWVLLTKDELPNMRKKSYKRQCQEVENWRKNSSAFREGGYRVPKALEVVTSVVMEYVRNGVRFYSDDNGASRKWTFTRCVEMSTRGCPVLIGGFNASGINVNDIDRPIDGLGCVREV